MPSFAQYLIYFPQLAFITIEFALKVFILIVLLFHLIICIDVLHLIIFLFNFHNFKFFVLNKPNALASYFLRFDSLVKILYEVC